VDLQTEVLESLRDAVRYRRWLAGLALPHLGDHPIEIGSGNGSYAAEWAPRLWRLTATEAHPERLVALKERFADAAHVSVRPLSLPLDAEDLSLDATDGRRGGYSAAVAINVLEHIEDDVAALRSMAGLVRPGGAVVLLVPAFPALMSHFDRAVGHVRRYTRASLGQALERAGLARAELRYVNPIGVLSWFLAVRTLRMTPNNGPLVRLFDRFAVPPQRRLERHVRPPFGQSVFAVARLHSGGSR
jgi:SAM-dependent methyltransferase